MSSPPWPMKRLTLRFHDEALEQRFRAAEDGNALRYSRFAGVAGFLITGGAAVLMHLLVPPAWLGTDAVLEGGLYLCTVFALMTAGTWLPASQRAPQFATALGSVVFSLLVIAILDKLPPEFLRNRGFLLLLLQMFAIYGMLRLRIVPAAVAGTVSVLLYVGVVAAKGRLELIDVGRHFYWLSMGNVWGMLVCWQLDESRRREFVAREALSRERERAESLLLNILPAPIAARLKASPQRIAEHAEPVTVLFADIVDFTPLSAGKQPAELVELLDRVFTGFDELASRHGLEKIKTIGDAYMAVAGLPHPQADHAVRGARMALSMVEHVARLAAETGEPLQVRIGMHTGPVVAGVIGRSKFSYDLWGDTVNTASRMESAGMPGAVHCTQATADCVKAEFAVRSRGLVDIKGKGPMETFVLSPGPA